jgi:serine protease
MARWAWTQPNGDGAGVGFIDVEQGWITNHEDLIAKTPTIIFGDNRNGVDGYKGDHGTAVLGVMAGVDNSVG